MARMSDASEPKPRRTRTTKAIPYVLALSTLGGGGTVLAVAPWATRGELQAASDKTQQREREDHRELRKEINEVRREVRDELRQLREALDKCRLRAP